MNEFRVALSIIVFSTQMALAISPFLDYTGIYPNEGVERLSFLASGLLLLTNLKIGSFWFWSDTIVFLSVFTSTFSIYAPLFDGFIGLILSFLTMVYDVMVTLASKHNLLLSDKVRALIRDPTLDEFFLL